MKKIILCLFSLLLIISFCVPTIASSQSSTLNFELALEEHKKNSLNNAYHVYEYLSKNLDPSLWGSLTYMSGPYVVIGVPDVNKQSEIEKVLDKCYKNYGLNQFDTTGDIDKNVQINYVSCKYSQKQLNSIVSTLQKSKVIKDSKYKIRFDVNWNGFISVDIKSKDTTSVNIPANEYDAIYDVLSKYKTVIRINTTKTNLG